MQRRSADNGKGAVTEGYMSDIQYTLQQTYKLLLMVTQVRDFTRQFGLKYILYDT